MAEKLEQAQIDTISRYDSEQRLKYLLKEVCKNREIWILTDDIGCVMLNSEDEDCVPVWPNEAFARAWATGEWQDCQAEAIPLNQWHSRWTPGLIEDELSVAVFPNQTEEGIVLYPDELDFELKNQAKKGQNRK